jgi:hypothetical protein
VYAHQQYFQKPAQPQMYQMQAPQNSISQTQSQAKSLTQPQIQTNQQRDFPDVPVDSTSIIERMLQNLKKVRRA